MPAPTVLGRLVEPIGPDDQLLVVTGERSTFGHYRAFLVGAAISEEGRLTGELVRVSRHLPPQVEGAARLWVHRRRYGPAAWPYWRYGQWSLWISRASWDAGSAVIPWVDEGVTPEDLAALGEGPL